MSYAPLRGRCSLSRVPVLPRVSEKRAMAFTLWRIVRAAVKTTEFAVHPGCARGRERGEGAVQGRGVAVSCARPGLAHYMYTGNGGVLQSPPGAPRAHAVQRGAHVG